MSGQGSTYIFLFIWESAMPLFSILPNAFNELDAITKTHALHALESGKVIYLPEYTLPTTAECTTLFSNAWLDNKHKNISFDYHRQCLGGFQSASENAALDQLKQVMKRYAEFSYHLIAHLFPKYQAHIRFGRTSYRPAEIAGRIYSKRKDDTRLHVDAFPATPVQGLRILRVFNNINPQGQARTWHLGEPFQDVFKQFAAKLPKYRPAIAQILKWSKITKSLRSAYDHYQLHLHDAMKLDDAYQNSVQKELIQFPANSTWIVFTDQVSHAALSGQYLLEQTFYLPPHAMEDHQQSPGYFWDMFSKKINKESYV